MTPRARLNCVQMEYILSNDRKRVYNARDIGERRLGELGLRCDNVISNEIDVVELGTFSIRNVPVMVALVGPEGHKAWRLVSYTSENIDRYFGHCYVVTGRRIRHIGGRVRTGSVHDVMKGYEHEERRERGLDDMDSEDIFRTCMGRGVRKRVSEKVREGGTIKWVCVTKRFDNSRLTCVCKSRDLY